MEIEQAANDILAPHRLINDYKPVPILIKVISLGDIHNLDKGETSVQFKRWLKLPLAGLTSSAK